MSILCFLSISIQAQISISSNPDDLPGVLSYIEEHFGGDITYSVEQITDFIQEYPEEGPGSIAIDLEAMTDAKLDVLSGLQPGVKIAAAWSAVR